MYELLSRRVRSRFKFTKGLLITKDGKQSRAKETQKEPPGCYCSHPGKNGWGLETYQRKNHCNFMLDLIGPEATYYVTPGSVYFIWKLKIHTHWLETIINSWFSSTTVWIKLDTAGSVHANIMAQSSNMRQGYNTNIFFILVPETWAILNKPET